MDSFLELITNLTEPEWIVAHGGLYIVMLIIFLETGLFLGFFLPGDYLLFITGILIANTEYPFDVPIGNYFFWSGLITICAVLGNMMGYWFGYKSGRYLFTRKDSFLFKKKHLEQARNFYTRKGAAAIIIARFLPIIRTFAPIVAGVVKMDRKKFINYNIAGAILWVFSLVAIGFIFGKNEEIKKYLDYIIVGIFVVTTFPVLYKLIRFRFKS